MDLCFEMLHLVTGSTVVINNVMLSTVKYLGPHIDDFIDFMDVILSGIASQNAIRYGQVARQVLRYIVVFYTGTI